MTGGLTYTYFFKVCVCVTLGNFYLKILSFFFVQYSFCIIKYWLSIVKTLKLIRCLRMLCKIVMTCSKQERLLIEVCMYGIEGLKTFVRRKIEKYIDYLNQYSRLKCILS